MDVLDQLAKTHHFKKNEVVFHINQVAEQIFKVVSGEVHLYRIANNGKKVLIFRAITGDFFAEASLLSNKYHCTAECMQTTEIQSYNAKQFLNYLETDNQFAMAWITRLSSELRLQRTNVERLNLKTASERITHFILTEGSIDGELEIKGSLTDMAEMIGISRESLYRTLALMEKEEKLTRTEKSIRLT